jgi:hypothetical protein
MLELGLVGVHHNRRCSLYTLPRRSRGAEAEELVSHVARAHQWAESRNE